jgi:hypothetical protein
MMIALLCIIAIYAAAAAGAHWAHRNRTRASRRHYVLVATNHETYIEAYVRALRRYSLRTGTDIGITVMLDQSTDATAAIVKRLQRRHEGLLDLRGAIEKESYPSAIWVRLDRPDEVEKYIKRH